MDLGSIINPIKGIADGARSIIGAFKLDPAKEAEFNAKMREFELRAYEQQAEREKTLIQEQSKVIQAEANSESWLAKNWRPIAMLAFTGLVVAYFLGYAAPNISEPRVEQLLGIVQVGLGGYVIGRTGEKMVKAWRQPDMLKAQNGDKP